MKFTKATWIVLLVCILVFAAACLGWVYSQQVDQQRQLNSQLLTQKNKLRLMSLDELNQQKDQVTLQIQQLNDQLASNKNRLKLDEDSITVTDSILALAKSYKIDITEIRSSGLSSEELAGTSLSTLAIDLSVQGGINDIANFATGLNERYPTSIDTLVQLDRIPPSSTPTIVPSGENIFSGTLSLVIYNYEGN
jgi:Tfp pilus assembly protein PilO